MLKDENHKKELQLVSLIEFSHIIHSTLDLKFILDKILLTFMGKMLISKSVFLLKTDIENTFRVKSSKGIEKKYNNRIFEFSFPKEPYFTLNDVAVPCNFLNEKKLTTFFKIYFEKKLLGVLSLGEKANKEELTKSEIVFIETLLNIASPAIENTLKFEVITHLNKSLNLKLHHLKTQFELGKEFSTNFQDEGNIMKILHFALYGNLGIKDSIIFSITGTEKADLIFQSKNYKISTEYLLQIENSLNPICIKDGSDNLLYRKLFENNFKVIIPFPQNKSETIYICLGSRINNEEYSDNDIEFIQSMSNLAFISVNNARLFREYLEKKKLESELELAKEIQRALLPSEIPDICNYQIAAINIPASQVGGDYYDIIKIDSDHYAFVIADVSGKGTPASLLMSNIQSAVHSYIKLYHLIEFKLEHYTMLINELIYQNTSAEKFITFFWGILDNVNNTFQYINAGHNPPLYLSRADEMNGQFTELEKGCTILGIMEKLDNIETGEIKLYENDILVLYTDGISEALNKKGDEYGLERLQHCISHNHKQTPETILSSIESDISRFTHDTKQSDDMTLIVLKRE